MKIRPSKSSSLSSCPWFLMASRAADWPPHPRAAEVERGVNASPACYMYACAPLRHQEEALERAEKHQRRDNPSRDLDITAAGSRRTPYGLSQQQRGVRKVWRNAVSVPAPDHPAVRLQQPAGLPADGGLLVRSDAPARRLLQLRHRWVTGCINRFTVVN